MGMRVIASRFGRGVYCNRRMLSVEAVHGVPMPQVIQRFPEAMRRAVLLWMTRGGPFWDDIRRHHPDDWLESGDEIVTDSAVGEAAYRSLQGLTSGLISVTPSNWDFSPVAVIWKQADAGREDRRTELLNWRTDSALEESLRTAPVSLRSWEDLQRVSKLRCPGLTFSDACFGPLDGLPFAKGAAERVLALLDILERFSSAFDASGVRTTEGQRMYQNYFTGDNALFSDSSDTEKRNFRNELTFPHPSDPNRRLFSTWHGKIRPLTLRLHYSWSGQAGDAMYIVYIGPKITRR